MRIKIVVFIKNISSRMKNLAVQGAGLSKWEADVLVDVIEGG